MFAKNNTKAEYPPKSNHSRPIDLDAEDENSVRGGKLRKERASTKILFKLWILWLIFMVVITAAIVPGFSAKKP